MPKAVCECNTRARSEPHEIARFPSKLTSNRSKPAVPPISF